MEKFIINKELSGITLEKFLNLKVDTNKTFSLMMIRKKIIKVNLQHAKDLKMILNFNDEVILYLAKERIKETNIRLPFDIIYEDENLIIVDKPVKLPIHYDGNSHYNILDLVNNYLKVKGEINPSFTAQVSNRLDTNTRGLVIISKNKETLEVLNEAIRNREIRKYYLAFVKGTFSEKSGEYKDYLIKDEEKGLSKIVKDKEIGSLEVITKYRVLETYKSTSKIEVELVTGRLHQIRCHMAYYKHPVIGDNKYGDKNLNNILNMNYQELIAYKLVFGSKNLKHLSYLENKVYKSKMTLNTKNGNI